MTVTEFEDALGRYLRAEPFVPFEVELENGDTIRVERPVVAFHGGGATYWSEEDGLVQFRRSVVRQFRPAPTRAGT